MGNSDIAGIPEDKWLAVLSNDRSYDGQWYYGVKTTGIFCRPSCKSKPPNRSHVRIFHTAREALSEQFRPCKRCKPVQQQLPDEEWAAQACAYIEAHYQEALPLTLLSDVLHLSPYHLQRTFKRLTGLTPAAYIQQIRIREAMKLLASTDLAVTDIAGQVGFANAAHFATRFQGITGLTPTQYRGAKREP
ncbi:AraC family transcriptional regulator, regulatory protein of adaptative response / methylphosphotriester-DNA alkyltransferase methyltransferase [Paenibacillus catalpae]|uniref:AraC family transcriptional regulator, regulatory protein of adaptative response / methylphosphotriester-DNA alkyltransferase methyltransferase n=1 Tax=Paenibacillus catalpae TaxID=1045775 RepID=A0A1I1X225_9BACL|nr:bifunctional transcriptional activator/DNA repair enzyme AdaA [Paenibacillus catalpae]SFE00668.1 AraC family transcriptional regulator, regulatory protein of adaptative response / methylphosphotriester-DNA alkyltransferase methyltransferase [Paenibacillus catalpae]